MSGQPCGCDPDIQHTCLECRIVAAKVLLDATRRSTLGLLKVVGQIRRLLHAGELNTLKELLATSEPAEAMLRQAMEDIK